MKKVKYIYGLLLLSAVLCGSCNKDWVTEQYRQYISFKAPLDNSGVSQISVRYKPDGYVTYRLPVIVSGSTTNERNITVHVRVDSDTLQILNRERYQDRTDFYYRELDAGYFKMPESIDISAGEDIALLDIDFSLVGIDLVDKWVLPLTVVDDPSYNYLSHPRKHYGKALLNVRPFNDYSGIYGGTALKTFFKGYEDDAAMVRSEIPVYVVDEHTVFFYAGTVDENRIDRRNYKIYMAFDSETGNVTLSSDNPNMEFRVTSQPSFLIREAMDATLPYLLHRYVTVSGIAYEYTDYTMVPGTKIEYTVNGVITMERKINTQIPDEDQAIEW
ncbi:MAG: DUF4973 domain-containing protein [Bacteroidales bacterium]|nr:DUF4973 domain-containing protein [Bacteroidales bacterium]